jgi:toxin YoeB
MTTAFTPGGWEDYLFWQSADRRVLRRINELIKDTVRHPEEGLGKPEPLRGDLRGWWSRRITDEHRMVYRVVDDTLVIAQLRRHY